jgi:hypothetical protein
MKGNEKIEVKGSYLNYIKNLINQSPNFFKYEKSILQTLSKNLEFDKELWYKISQRQLNKINQVCSGKIKDNLLRYSALN